jgi:hypothetical protein
MQDDYAIGEPLREIEQLCGVDDCGATCDGVAGVTFELVDGMGIDA